jgi:cysteine desulfurase family protein
MIYLDNAATTWPKPDRVGEAMLRYMNEVGASPGRSGHRLANEAERLRFDAREAVAELFGLSDPTRVIFALNATAALNLVLRGILSPGAHVVTTSMEHNAVMRPLRALERRGVRVSVVPCRNDGTVDLQDIDEHVSSETRLIVANHASNVCGTVLPVREIGARARRLGVPFLVDAAQTAGSWQIDLEADHIDKLAFTGHKGMLGPSGTGGLAISEAFDIEQLPPLMCGGTGSRSERELQPDFLPDKYEAGTPNTVGLVGLTEGVRYVLERGVSRIREHEQFLTQRLIDELVLIEAVKLFGTRDSVRQTGTASFAIAGCTPSDVALALDERFDIMCRPGLHCAPRAHQTLGTLPEGTVRFSVGPYNTEGDVDSAVAAVADLAGGA